jgi:signal transduction histidine kinase/CheY-like chemotaxis protein
MSSAPKKGSSKAEPRVALVPLAAEAEQLRAVYDVAVAVTRAGALPEIYEAALDALQASLGADRASILLFDPDGVMRFKAWRGLSEAYRRAVEGHSPWSPGVRGAMPVLVPDVDRDASLETFRATIRGEGIRALGFIPVYSAENLLGKFMVYFNAPHVFTREEVRLAEIIANHVAFAVERRRSEEELERYVTERKRSEAAARFLAEASGRLDASLDYDATLDTIPQLAVPYLADWCLVEVAEGAPLRRLAVAHADPSGLPLVQELRERWLAATAATDEDARSAGRCRFGAEAMDWLLCHFGADPGVADLIRRLAPACAITVPLTARGRTLGTMTCVSSAGDRRCGEAELAVAQDLGQRAGLALNNARLYGEAQESDRRKDEFLAMLAHELRNPLAPMLTALQLMELRPDDAAVVERARVVLGRQVRHMTRLVDDLLDVSRITRGKIVLRTERVDLAALAARALDAARPLMEGRRLEVSAQVPSGLFVNADPVRMEQVLLNLLNNAAKFTEPGGRVHVWAEAVDGRVTIGVSDSGIGIAPELLPRIFDLFMQGERSLDRTQGGLGIGLTLVHRLVEMHGGIVGAASAGLGQGSEFVIELPLASEAGPETTVGESVAPSAAAAPRRILVVDDNVDAARTLAEALAGWGHEVAVAHDGPAAVEKALRDRPDVVLLDIGLPGMDGYAVAEQLRSEPRLSDTVLVALSGYGQLGDRVRSQRAGFREHLVKPVDLEALAALFR